MGVSEAVVIRTVLIPLGVLLVVLVIPSLAPGEPVRAATSSVTIVDFAFQPPDLTVNVNDTVTWTNNGPSFHTSTSDGGFWDSMLLLVGQSFPFTFANPGTFPYRCTIHPTLMRGVITVLGPASPTATPTPTPSPTPTPTVSPTPTSTPTSAALANLAASLTGAAEVPGPADPDGTGSALITVDPAQRRVCFQLSVANLSTPIAAHIHRGVVGVAGPIVVTLGPPVGGSSSGCLENLDRGLLNEIAQNPSAFYVNVHTTEFPGGAIRGQLALARTALAPAVAPALAPTPTPTPPSDTERDGPRPRRLTEEQRQQRERTNKLGLDDYRTEGDVVETHCEADWPYILLANRDGLEQVRLPREVQCSAIQPGDYLEASGVKQTEQLFDADSLTVHRGGSRIR